MVPAVVTTPSKYNLLHAVGGADKSLTSLSFASDSSNQLLEIPLQQVTPTSVCSFTTKNSPKNVQSNGTRREGKCNGPVAYSHPSTPVTSPITAETNFGLEHDHDDNCNNNSKDIHELSFAQETSESCTTTTTSANSLNVHAKVEKENKQSANGTVSKGDFSPTINNTGGIENEAGSRSGQESTEVSEIAERKESEEQSIVEQVSPSETIKSH